METDNLAVLNVSVLGKSQIALGKV